MTRSLTQDSRGKPLPSLGLLGLLIAVALAWALAACDSESVESARISPQQAAASGKLLLAEDLGRIDDFENRMSKARAWFDQLEIDPVALMHAPVRVKGKKKLAEIIATYQLYLEFAEDAADRQAIMGRLREFERQANRPAYHDIAELDDRTLKENSMSYLRVPFLLEELGFDMSAYRAEIIAVKSRLDDHFEQRGPWQRAMFAKYYDHFELQKPWILRRSAAMRGGVVMDRLPIAEYDRQKSYSLTHEVFVAYLYGEQRKTEQFDQAETCHRMVPSSNPEHARAKLYLADVEASQNMYYDREKEKEKTRRNQILQIPVTDFELSVRSRNCLAKMNIHTLGDLIRKTEAELLSYKNFGETSLTEIKKILAQKGFRLGQGIEDKPTPRQLPDSEQAKVLGEPVSVLDLSSRAQRCMDRLGIESLNDLVKRTELELISQKNFGMTSLNELKTKLKERGLSLASG